MDPGDFQRCPRRRQSNEVVNHWLRGVATDQVVVEPEVVNRPAVEAGQKGKRVVGGPNDVGRTTVLEVTRIVEEDG